MAAPTLVLWDIDHTLIKTRGVGRKLYRAAFEEITGRPMEHKVDLTGKTEPAILTETLKAHGLEPNDDYQAKYAEALARLYEQHTDRLRKRGRVLPGAREALAALAEQPDAVQTVLRARKEINGAYNTYPLTRIEGCRIAAMRAAGDLLPRICAILVP
jgi:phosphoglycolate phosphatase-like HAD superfamily hydrolase